MEKVVAQSNDDRKSPNKDHSRPQHPSTRSSPTGAGEQGGERNAVLGEPCRATAHPLTGADPSDVADLGPLARSGPTSWAPGGERAWPHRPSPQAKVKDRRVPRLLPHEHRGDRPARGDPHDRAAAHRLPRRRQQPHGVRHGRARLAGDRRRAEGHRLRRRAHRRVRRPDRPHAGQPVTPTRSRPNPVDISPEELQFIIDHGSSLLSEGFYSMLVEKCATTLLPLI